MVVQQDLVPYVSAVLARVPHGTVGTFVGDLADEITTLIPTLSGDALREVAEEIPPASTSVGGNSLASAGLIYSETRPPRFAPASDLEDVVHHLVLVCRRNRAIAIYTSDPAMGRRLAALFGSADHNQLGRLVPFVSANLNGAFLRGETRTVWMSGLHRRTVVKADSKILAGVDLRAALEPLGDQTYRFTAARGSMGELGVPTRPNGDVVVGVSPQKSRIWAGPAKDWADFAAMIFTLLGEADQAAALANPLPVLATPAATGADLDGPYDISVIDPILLSAEGHSDEKLREEAEKWADRARFEIGDVVDPLSFPVTVTLDDVNIGELQITVAIGADGKTTLNIEKPDDASEELLAARRAALRRDWLTVRYESGHTVTGEQVFSIRFQDRIFTGWMWEDFDVNGRDFDVKKEKPTKPNSTAFDPESIGNAGERSLFSWTFAHWRDQAGQEGTGWLASDDGAGEIADFIHIDESGDVPLLSLIHVKGSKVDNNNREISTSDYEVVVGQAIKNLRFLDLPNLANQLETGKNKEVAQANWHDSVQQDDKREALVEAIRQLGTNMDVQIVVLQPRVTKSDHDGARKDADDDIESPRLKRLRQLDALLLEAQAACQAMGARFVVVGDAQGNP